MLDDICRASSLVAVESNGRRWSYLDLEAGVTRVAELLRDRAGQVVAVTGPRSFRLVGCIVAVLRASAVLLTIDPRLPEARQRLMLEQAGAQLLLRTDDQCLREWRELHLPRHELPADSGYVVFTSGSTGQPKAVLGRRSSLAHFIRWQRETFGIRADDRFAQLTGLSFDVLLRDLLTPLSSGATLCIPSQGRMPAASELLDWLTRQQVTVLHTVPSLMRHWLAQAPAGYRPSPLRLVFFAGEPLTDVLIADFRRVFGPGAELVNLYGPTETTLAKCFYRVPDVPERGVQPIGTPMPDTEVLVVDDALQPCRVGEIGQLAIRTLFPSYGYLGAPELTVRAFCPLADGRPAYLTGDRGRRRPDGLLEIHGRIDRQVKIRGVRIEPAEVELALSRDPRVLECAVAAQEDELVAFVVLREGGDPDALVDPLRATLPNGLLPSRVVQVQELPLNQNGKLDRDALLTVPCAPAREPPLNR